MVEAAMIGGALNTAAEQVVEYTAYGHLITSAGNASPLTEQMVVRCMGDDQWVAITIPDGSACARSPKRRAPRTAPNWKRGAPSVNRR